jgi:hypothetical protein
METIREPGRRLLFGANRVGVAMLLELPIIRVRFLRGGCSQASVILKQAALPESRPGQSQASSRLRAASGLAWAVTPEEEARWPVVKVAGYYGGNKWEFRIADDASPRVRAGRELRLGPQWRWVSRLPASWPSRLRPAIKVRLAAKEHLNAFA